jgi:hypothetical protein
MAIAPEITKALEVYDPRTQISTFQMRLIMGVIAQHRFAARFLIRGCGYDSRFWRALNAHGRTLFVEHDASWTTGEPVHGLEVVGYPQLPTSVAHCEARVDAAALGGIPAPGWSREAWDVVLIDGPKGYRPDDPGRALPTFWAASVHLAKADVFVDDYDRPLERLYCDELLRVEGRPSSILPGNAGKEMFWRMA